MEDKMKFRDVIDALTRMASHERYKASKITTMDSRLSRESKALLFESAIYYLDIHAKRIIQGNGRKEI